MNPVFIPAIALVLLAVMLVVFARREARRHGTGTAEELAGICSVAFERTSRKEARKMRVLELLADKGELSNADIREALGVSRQSVVRYMDELEQEGKVRQIGDMGQGVIYRLK